MKYEDNPTRRDFLKKITIAGSTFYLGMGGIFARAESNIFKADQTDIFEYKYKTFSVDHLDEVKKWIDKLRDEDRISNNKTFRSYIEFDFDAEKVLPGVKSVIIASLKQNTGVVVFNYKGKQVRILIPTGGYFYTGKSFENLKVKIMDDIIKDPSKKIDENVPLPYKTLAVRSGLADYGKNNITYVDGHGSYHQLYCFYTDKELEDNWRPLNMLRQCKGCTICIKECPTKCFREDNFTIDVNECITLYNETTEPFPDFVPANAHNTLVGCLKCQAPCPANETRINDLDILAELSEDETEFLLGDTADKEVHDKIIKKLERYPSAKNLNYFRRNFKLAFANLVDK